MSTQTANAVRLSRTFPVDGETVFDAWTTPDHMRHWACPESATVEHVEADPVIGGAYKIRMRGSEGEIYTAFGTYREIDRPRSLVYTWDWEEGEHAVGETLVTVQFNDLGGSTEVVVTHEGFPAEDAANAHEEGWTSCLNRLATLLD